MRKLRRFGRTLATVALLGMLLFAAPMAAQSQNAAPVRPLTGSDAATANINDQALLRVHPRVEGFILIPDTKARVLIQPAGREWRYFHEVLLHWGGAAVILATLAGLALFYAWRGKVRISAGRSGIEILRFLPFERFAHWLTASSFVVLALTGLNVTFGKIVLLPLVGPSLFSDIARSAKTVHNFFSFAFVLGLVLIVALFIKDNWPRKMDVTWVLQGGGIVGPKHPPAGRFNAGEKLVFWSALVFGTAVSVSGYLLLFPFYVTDIAGMQIAQVVHGVISVLFVAVILGHIYIGTLGMEGAFEAMGSGHVDLNWAKEHHSAWLEEERTKGRSTTVPPASTGTVAKA